LPESSSATDWATRWHKLGSFKTFDDTYKAALQSITDGFTERGADPNRPNGNSINQVRTNELVWGNPWSIREFNLTADGLVRSLPSRRRTWASTAPPTLRSGSTRTARTFSRTPTRCPMSF